MSRSSRVAPFLHRLREQLAVGFFGPTDARNLGLFRILYCVCLLLTVVWEFRRYRSTLQLLSMPGGFTPITLFNALGIHSVSPGTFSVLHGALLATLLCAAAGLMTRWSLAAAGLAFLGYFGTIHSVMKPLLEDRLGHATDMAVFILLVLAVSPDIGRWGVDGWLARRRGRSPNAAFFAPVPSWPLQTVKLLLALAYFGASYSKLSASGLRWADGVALQAFLFEKALSLDKGLGFWIAERLWLCSALSVATLVFESSFFLVLFFPRLALPYAAAGLAMHALILKTMGISYFLYFAPAYCAFLSWPGTGPASFPTFALAPRPRRWATALIVSLLVVNLACIATHYNAWPLSNWRFYQVRPTYDSISAYRLQEVSLSGERRWLPREAVPGHLFILSDKFRMAMNARNESWARANIRILIDRLPPARASKLKAVALVVRTVRKTPQGGFEFVDTPVLEEPVN